MILPTPPILLTLLCLSGLLVGSIEALSSSLSKKARNHPHHICNNEGNSNNHHSNNNSNRDQHVASRRRQLLLGLSVAVGWRWLPQDETGLAAAAASSNKPIAVLGASGRTGSLCVAACLRRGIAVRALTRSGTFAFPDVNDNVNSNLLTVAACNVQDMDALVQGVRGCQGVIYAASASKLGGTAQAIDNLGVVAAALACLSEQVERYVVISSTATTRPDSLGYKFTNVMGGIMDEKRKGEEGAQQLYKTAASSCSYTIVRPGGLEEPKKNEVLGPSALEISQGDVLAGIISRADLAEFTVELTRSSSPNLKNTALELYYASSVQPCERRFKPLLQNGQAPRIHGDSYDELLRGIHPEIDYLEL